MKKTLIFDNGAHTLKVGQGKQEVKVFPNGKFRAKNDRKKDFLSSELNDCKDFSSLFYQLPLHKGYLLNWSLQKNIWEFVLGKENLDVDTEDYNMILTEPQCNFRLNQSDMSEMLFEEFKFQKVIRTNASMLANLKFVKSMPGERCSVIVDSGYSSTHIVPYFNNKKVVEALTRIDIGGKFLTNHLKELVSYGQLQVMDETYVVNQMKEELCFMSTDFKGDMSKSFSKDNDELTKYYRLPDFTKVHKGYCIDNKEAARMMRPGNQHQVVRMNSERFRVPELLLHPSDIGVPQMGIPEAIVRSIERCPEEIQAEMYRNIVLVGGNFKIPGCKERIEAEVRKLTPHHFNVEVHLPHNPVTYACEGGQEIVKSSKMWVSAKEYEEYGMNICYERFGHI